MTRETVAVELGGIPETLLWTLYQRAVEARRPGALIHDPQAVELVARIDYPFEERFGHGFGQWQALRAGCFDRAVRAFLAAHPDGTVVALGEGLETQLWRVDNGRVEWVSVDLPDVVALRERLLPASPRQQLVGLSAFDTRWLDEVDPSRGALVTAQGLLMYFERDEAYGLIADCASRLPGGTLVLDVVPRWLAQRSREGKLARPGAFTAPPWLWGAGPGEEQELAAIPGVRSVKVLRPARGRGPIHGLLLPLLASFPPARRRMLSILRLELGQAAGPARPPVAS